MAHGLLRPALISLLFASLNSGCFLIAFGFDEGMYTEPITGHLAGWVFVILNIPWGLLAADTGVEGMIFAGIVSCLQWTILTEWILSRTSIKRRKS